MISVLVAGGLGFMGSHFVRYLESLNEISHIRVLDNYSYSANPEAISGLDVEIVEGDIRDYEAVISACKGVDVVINFAAETHNDNSIQRPLDFFDTNLNGVLTLLQAARERGFRFHQVSTDEVFGDLPLDSEASFEETTPYLPSSPYSASKAAADLAIGAWSRTFGVVATITHSANNFGVGQHREKLIPRMLERVSRGANPELYGSGLNVRDWLNVEDHSRAVWAVSNLNVDSFEPFNVSSGDLHSNLEVARFVNEAFGRSLDAIDYVKDRPGHDLKYASNSEKLKAATGWEATSMRLHEWLRHEVDKMKGE